MAACGSHHRTHIAPQSPPAPDLLMLHLGLCHLSCITSLLIKHPQIRLVLNERHIFCHHSQIVDAQLDAVEPRDKLHHAAIKVEFVARNACD